MSEWAAGQAGPGSPDPGRPAAIADLLARRGPEFLARQRWFGGKTRTIDSVRAIDAAPIDGLPDLDCTLAIAEVAYRSGAPDRYLVPIARGRAAALAGRLGADSPDVLDASDETIAFDALADPGVARALLAGIAAGARLTGREGVFELSADDAGSLPAVAQDLPDDAIRRIRGEQSNTSIVFGQALILKALRRVEWGESLDLEIGRFLTRRAAFPDTPRVHGQIVYRTGSTEATLGILQAFVPNQGDAWTVTLDRLTGFAAAIAAAGPVAPADRADRVAAWTGDLLARFDRLGAVTAELHRALAGDPADPAFAPEPISARDLTAWQAGLAAGLDATLGHLIDRRDTLAPAARALAEAVVGRADRLRARIDQLPALADPDLTKTRHHGDYHLGQVLVSGTGFCILDFEGEPARPLADRRAKHTPLRDVAGMLRSIGYAAAAARRSAVDPPPDWAAWLAVWERLAARAFRRGYSRTLGRRGASFWPRDPARRRAWIDLWTLDKAIYELGYELNNRPDWVEIPLAALAD